MPKLYLYCLGLCFLLNITDSFGQEIITGRVHDESDAGIGYVNIGIVNSSIGTVSDDRGNFKLTLPDSLDINTLISFSHLSYEIRRISIADLKSMASSGKAVVLIHKDYNIDEITVFSGAIKEITFARKGFPVPGNASPIGIGREIGSVINADEQIKLTRFTFKTVRNSYEKTTVRINVYRIDHGSLVNILHVPIYCDIPKSKDSQEFFITPNENLILEQGDYFVSIEFVRLEGDGRLLFPVFLNKSYIRYNSMGPIQSCPFNIGLSIKGIKLSI